MPMSDDMRISWMFSDCRVPIRRNCVTDVGRILYGRDSVVSPGAFPDQWLRNWFLGGPDTVDYSGCGQIAYLSPEHFSSDLRRVWRNAATG